MRVPTTYAVLFIEAMEIITTACESYGLVFTLKKSPVQLRGVGWTATLGRKGRKESGLFRGNDKNDQWQAVIRLAADYQQNSATVGEVVWNDSH